MASRNMVDPFQENDVLDQWWEKCSQELREVKDQEVIKLQERLRKAEEKNEMLERKLTIAVRIINRVRHDVKLEV